MARFSVSTGVKIENFMRMIIKKNMKKKIIEVHHKICIQLEKKSKSSYEL